MTSVLAVGPSVEADAVVSAVDSPESVTWQRSPAPTASVVGSYPLLEALQTTVVDDARLGSVDDVEERRIEAEILQGQLLVLATVNQTRMARSRDEEQSLISSFNKQQRKYGTTSTYIKKPERYLSYEVQPGDTLQGVALRHNVTMEQLRRANRLWTNDSLALRPTLLVPVPLEPGSADGGRVDAVSADSGTASSASSESLQSTGCEAPPTGRVEATPTSPLDQSQQSASDFLSRIDSSIASGRRNVRQLSAGQPWTSPDEDVLFTKSPATVAPRGDRRRNYIWSRSRDQDPVALPLTVIRDGSRPVDNDTGDIYQL